MKIPVKPALFLDRDGVINHDYGYVSSTSDIDFIDGIFSLVWKANNAGWPVIIITNQAGVAHGYYDKDQFHTLMTWIVDEFRKRSCKIDDYFSCFSHPDAAISQFCAVDFRRKPAPGMLFEAAEKHNIDLGRSIFIGDQFTDVLAGLHAGIGNMYFFGCTKRIFNLPAGVSIISSLKQVVVEGQ